MDKKIAVLLSIVFVDLLGFGIVIPILPLLIERIGGGPFMIGVLIAVFSFFQFLSASVWGRLSDKYGRKPILVISTIINAVGYLLIFLSPNIWILFLGRVLGGIGSGNLSVVQAYVADTSEAHERTKRMALIGATFGLGFIFGPFIGGSISARSDLQMPFLLTAILSAVGAVLVAIVLPESNKTLQKHIKIEFINVKVTKEILKPKNMLYLMFLFFLVNFSLSLIIGVFPLLSTERFGWGEEQNGYYFALIGLGSFITQAFGIRLLLKRYSELMLVTAGLVLFGITNILVGVSDTVLLVLIAGCLSAVGFSLLNANIQALISLESNAQEQGLVLGVAQSFASLARVVGPLLGGIIATYHLNYPYYFSGIILFLTFLWGQKYLKGQFLKK